MRDATFDNLSASIINRKLVVRILEFGDAREQMASRLSQDIQKRCPNLKTLVIFLNESQLVHFSGLFNRLKFLYLRVGQGDQALSLDLEERTITLPIITLQLETTSKKDLTFLNCWNLPLLEHLILKDSHWSYEETFFSHFLRNSGKRLLSLHIEIENDIIVLPANFWIRFPVLMYLGLTATAPFVPLPPPHSGHSICTLGMVKSHLGSREQFCRALANWECILTIADYHKWANMPEYYDPSSRSARGPYHVHDKDSYPCWKGVQALHAFCLDRDFEYVDHTGITLDPFIQQSTSKSG